MLGITIENADTLRELIQTAAVEGEVVQQDTTPFGQLFKVDWTVLGTQEVQLLSNLGNYINKSQSSLSFCLY